MFSLWQLAALFGTGAVAGLVDSIAGGGGLITLPVLLAMGLDPQAALGTNKLQSTFGVASASANYARLKLLRPGEWKRTVCFTLAGAMAGTLAVQRLDPQLLRRAIPIVLVVIALYALVRPDFGSEAREPRLRRPAFDVGIGLLLGFYDGFIGPPVGTFWTIACIVGLGMPLLHATAATKLMNLASNIASLIFFAAAGQVLFSAGLVMGLGQLVGAHIGSGLAVQRGHRFVRTIFVLVALAITVKLLRDVFAP
jgi:uncharacterized protein